MGYQIKTIRKKTMRERLNRKEPKAFAKGHPRHPDAGRKPGSANRTTRLLKEAAILAAEAAGNDGKGKDALVGYLKFLATEYPPSFATILGKIIPLQIKMNSEKVNVVYTTKEEVMQELQRRGIPCQQLFGPSTNVVIDHVG